ncbi:MAG: alpha-mannosidase, partial [Abditibacteriota bacterium]|nr:alpha-mannosidase [Abditibacteriota bacterium]
MASMNAVLRTRLNELKGLIITDSRDIEGWECENALFLDMGKYEYKNNKRSVSPGDVWAKAGETAFFKKTVAIPPEWKGGYVALEFLAAGEGLLSVNGEYYSGIDDNRGYICLTREAAGGEELVLDIEMKTGGYHEYLPRDRRMPFILRTSRMYVVDKAAEAAWFDFLVPFEVASSLDDGLLKDKVYDVLYKCLLTADLTRSDERDYVIPALTAAAEELKKRLADIDFGKAAGEAVYTGHSHIDVAWLWPLKESMRKAGRTYSTVASLMDEFPEYHFNCSQVPLYLYLKKNFPSVYERIKARAAEGRFEPIGGTWVENDTNLPSGESLVRQCLYGQRFFMKEFGKKVKVGWLPDVFGYSWSLPQIYKKSGIDYFMTTKLTWNDTNKFPYKAFLWEGIDGSRLKCFLSNTYVDNLDFPGHYNTVVRNYPDKLTEPDYLAVFGFGDGGGGPTRYNLEKIRRLNNAPGFPRARTGTVESFFENSVEKASDRLPVWNGELYFEYHRGTYTSQANNKKNNRKCELALRNAEIMGSLAKEYGFVYPKEALTSMWETVLLNQFHDIIPGSSITEVYRESSAQYEEVLKGAGKIIRKAAQHIADSIGVGANQFIVFNTLSHLRTDVIEIKNAPFGMAVYDANGEKLPSQYESDTLVAEVPAVPPTGFKLITLKKEKAEKQHEFAFSGKKLSSPFFDITFNDDGTIGSIWDKDA